MSKKLCKTIKQEKNQNQGKEKFSCKSCGLQAKKKKNLCKPKKI